MLKSASVVFFVLMFLSLSGCRKGCIDANALNYQPEANANNGCIYPETFNLTSIGVNYHPSQDSEGEAWDSLDNPDKFIRILNHETDKVLFVTETEEFLPVNWSVDPILSVDSETVILRFELYDKDDDIDVLMDRLVLNLKELTGRSASSVANDYYPESDIIEGENGSGFSMAIIWTE